MGEGANVGRGVDMGVNVGVGEGVEDEKRLVSPPASPAGITPEVQADTLKMSAMLISNHEVVFNVIPLLVLRCLLSLPEAQFLHFLPFGFYRVKRPLLP